MPPFDVQKHSFTQSMNRFVDGKVDDALSLLAKSMPCSVEEVVEANNTIVKVKIEIQAPGVVWPLITCPVYGPEYLRWPLQKGDKGVMLSADYYLGGVSGLGTGVASLTPQFNLATGVFFPIGNTVFGDTDDPEKVVIYGPEGVILKGCPIPHKETEDSEEDLIRKAFDAPSTRANGLAAPRANVPADGGGEDCGKVDVNKHTVDITVGEDAKATVNAQGVEQAFGVATRTVVDAEGFKVYINGSLTFIVDAGGMRWLGGNAISGGGHYGINVTPTGTHIDDVNFLPHVHKGVTRGSQSSDGVDDVVSPAAANEDAP